MPPKISMQDALATGRYGGFWTQGTVIDISGATQRKITIGADTDIIRIDCDSRVYLLFDTDTSGSNATADDIRRGPGYFELYIPRGLRVGEGLTTSVIYLHVLQVTSVASKELRYVES